MADELLDAIGRQPLAQRANDGHAAADGGFVIEVDATLLGGGEQLLAVRGEQRLVGGDDVLAACDGVEHVGARRLLAADELEDDVDLGIGDHRLRIGGDQRGRDVDEARLLGLAHGDAADGDGRAAQTLTDRFGVIGQELDDARADVAEAQEADGNRTHDRRTLTRLGALRHGAAGARRSVVVVAAQAHAAAWAAHGQRLAATARAAHRLGLLDAQRSARGRGLRGRPASRFPGRCAGGRTRGRLRWSPLLRRRSRSRPARPSPLLRRRSRSRPARPSPLLRRRLARGRPRRRTQESAVATTGELRESPVVAPRARST